jgi:hypothetical protein
MREVHNPSCGAVERRDGHVAVLAVHRPEIEPGAKEV